MKPKKDLFMQSEKESSPLIYVPENARMNNTNNSMPPPTTDYERKRWTLIRDFVKKLVGGTYAIEPK